MRTLLILVIVFGLCWNYSYSQESGGSVASRLEQETIKVAQDVGKSVVSITAVVRERLRQPFYFGFPYNSPEDEFFRRFFEDFFGNLPQEYGRVALGSGVIIDKAGYILTNAHVIAGADEIKVILYNGKEFNAEVKGVDRTSDLAVVKISAPGLVAAKLGNSDDLRIGQFVLAMGNPFGISAKNINSEPTVTFGVISALHRYLPATEGRLGFDDLIQTDAAINPGNSGGPLVNLKGEVIGINMAIITSSGGYEGIGFAIPINRVKTILARLIRGEKVLYGWLGVSVQELTPDLRSFFRVKESEGVVVVKVFKDSPAEKAGLKEGDIIVKFGTHTIASPRELVNIVTSTEVGTVLPVGIIRGGKEIELKIRIGARPEDIGRLEPVEVTSFMGMDVENITPYLKRRFQIDVDEGVVIVNIDVNSPAERAGLSVGDVIVKINDKRIRNKDDFEKAVLTVGKKCLVKTLRGYFVLKRD